ncbi:MAG: amidase [Chthoniobacterales bacterium]|nr:amidase [Chthoniobacterales bacterium]
MHTEQPDQRGSGHGGVTRRTFVGTTLAGSAALLTGGITSVFKTSLAAAALGSDDPIIEATIPELQALMASGELTSRALTEEYLKRIAQLNPLLHAVIETNPDALSIAQRLDREREAGQIRGPLHGIPVLVKDNIATDDKMETTAGSLALVGSQVPADSVIVQQMRAAGAVILGKANLSEWANFRGFAPFNGWSARGGFTRDPYRLSFDPCGSSSGSAVASAANLCSVAVGTETDGSIVCPAGNNLVVGLKPTVGLVSQDGIIPISHSQDTAGPICRTVTDAAILLGVLQSPFGRVAREKLPTDYTQFLVRGALRGARIGIDRRYFTKRYGGEDDINSAIEPAIRTMETLGATLVPSDSGDSYAYSDAEFTVLLYEFKVLIAAYLAGLSNTSIRTLADLIDFDRAHCPQELKYFGQEIFQRSEDTSGDLTDPVYVKARALCLRLTRHRGIDAALRHDNLDALIAPSYSYASSPAAVAGYPNISVPVGFTTRGKPVGIWMYSTFLHEPQLLGLAYDLEQEIQARTVPQYRGQVPPEPPDVGICDGTRSQPEVSDVVGMPHLPRHLGTGKLFPL